MPTLSVHRIATSACEAHGQHGTARCQIATKTRPQAPPPASEAAAVVTSYVLSDLARRLPNNALSALVVDLTAELATRQDPHHHHPTSSTPGRRKADQRGIKDTSRCSSCRVFVVRDD